MGSIEGGPPPRHPRDYPEYDPDNPIERLLHAEWESTKRDFLGASPGERLVYRSNALLILVGIVAAGIYACQLHQMTKATGASQKAADTASTTLKIDQRAWVFVRNIAANEHCNWKSIDFTNSGHTPATKFTIQASFAPVLKGQPPNSEEKLIPGKGIIAPGGTFSSCIGDKSIDKTDWAKYDLFVHGTLIYWDVFGFQHWTKFCFRRSADGNFPSCETGNEIDYNGLPK